MLSPASPQKPQIKLYLKKPAYHRPILKISHIWLGILVLLVFFFAIKSFMNDYIQKCFVM